MRQEAPALLKVVLGSKWQSTHAQMHGHTAEYSYSKATHMSVLILKLNSTRNAIMEHRGVRGREGQERQRAWRKRETGVITDPAPTAASASKTS